MGAEQKVREAAAALLLAVSEAKAAGLAIQWPSKPEGLAFLAISETSRTIRATVTNLDGSPVERDADGLIYGQPVKLTGKQRALLPPLDHTGDAPAARVTGEMASGDMIEIPVVGSTEPVRIRGKRKHL